MRLTTSLVALSLFASCVTKEPPPSALAEGCLLNSDCASPLVCAFRRCHSACETSRDCPAGLHCRPADRPFNVCLLPDEIRCDRDTDCVNAMTCGVDGICRSPCTSALACLPEQTCVQGVCADALELVNGTLPVAIDAGFTCTRNSDCPVGELCARGVCIAECVNSRDCPVGATCVAGRCLGGRCALNSDCPPGQRCSPVGWCAPECVEPRDCPSGLVCLDNVCSSPPVMRDGGTDAGVTPDGGAMDGGSDPDAGGPRDAGARCVLNGDCAAGQWCDDGACAAPCGTGTCSGGRLCDGRLGVCVRACVQGCGPASVCDTSPDAGVDGGIGQCLSACDGTFRCRLGQVCRAGFCAPECLAPADCTNPHATCQRGQCVFDGTCDDDLDCPATEVCRLGTCTARPTSLVDAGSSLPPSFACVDPCDCRLGEWCSAGRCLPDPVPTLYFARDGGGDGRTPGSPAGNPFEALDDAGVEAVVALREGETWARSQNLALPTRLTLAGGFKACSPTRWVRADTLTTTLSFTNGVLTANGTTGSAVRSLTLEARGPASGAEGALITASGATGFTVEAVRGRLLDPGAVASGPGFVLGCSTCPNLVVRDLRLLPSGNPRVSSGLALIANAWGSLSRLVVDPQPSAHNLAFTGIAVANTTGPLVLEDIAVGDVEGRRWLLGVSISGCAGLARVERLAIAWPTNPIEYTVQVSVTDCPLELRGLQLTSGLGPHAATTTGLSLVRVSGVVEDVVTQFTGGAATFDGVSIGDPRGLTARRLSVRATTTGSARGVTVTGATQGPLLLERLDVDLVGGGQPLSAVTASSVTPGVGLRVHDSRLEVASTGPASCNVNPAAVSLIGSAAIVERSRVRVTQGGGPIALSVDSSSTLGLFASHASVGRATATGTCNNTARPAVLDVDGSARVGASTLDAEGDPFQFPPSTGILCGPSASLVVHSSVIGGGRAPAPLLMMAGCPTTNWRSSYFWLDRPGAAVDPADGALLVVQADAGVFDVNGNALAPNVSCFEPAVPDAGPPYRLRAGAACVDRGTFAQRADGTPVLLDLDGRPRDGGAGPDIGCSER